MSTRNKFELPAKAMLAVLAGIFITMGSLAQTTTATNKTTNMENTNGNTITLGGNTIHTVGKLPAVGTPVKDFTLTGLDLQEKTRVAERDFFNWFTRLF